eukprot:6490447-Amphidinium_carterae.9
MGDCKPLSRREEHARQPLQRDALCIRMKYRTTAPPCATPDREEAGNIVEEEDNMTGKARLREPCLHPAYIVIDYTDTPKRGDWRSLLFHLKHQDMNTPYWGGTARYLRGSRAHAAHGCSLSALSSLQVRLLARLHACPTFALLWQHIGALKLISSASHSLIVPSTTHGFSAPTSKLEAVSTYWLCLYSCHFSYIDHVGAQAPRSREDLKLDHSLARASAMPSKVPK